MDLKVACVIICLCALAIISTEAGIPKCCIKTKRHVQFSVLRKVYRMEWQNNTDACDIDALILYVRGWKNPVCAHPKIFDKLIDIICSLKTQPTFCRVRGNTGFPVHLS